MLLCFCRLQEEPFVNDEENRVGILGLNLLVSAVGTGHIEFKEHIRQADVLRFVALFIGLHAKGAGHVDLATSGSPSDEQVPMLCDILTACQPLDQVPVEFPAGGVVDAGNVSLWLIQSGPLDKPLQAVALAVAIFDVAQEAETVLERKVLHLRAVHLRYKSIRHGCQAHFNKFVDGGWLVMDLASCSNRCRG